MGAKQSYASGSATDTHGFQQKSNYYKLLGVSIQATDEEIKKAYRKKALELHPDRNYGNVDDTTRLFADIQVAYEVLSDPQERAWYDTHEAQFSNVTDDGHFENQQRQNIHFSCGNDILQIMRSFNGTVVFTDDPAGFYGFLRDTFATIAKEEVNVARKRAHDSEVELPSFGYMHDKYEVTVKHFYAVWSNFSTRKTFAWKDLYKYNGAPDRRLRRAAEKENKRLRDEGIHEFNDAVRSLVAFVRKRDPRYIPTKQTEAERQNALRDIAAAQAARSRAMNEARIRDQTLPEWAVFRELEEQLESDESTSEEEQFECVACSKIFRSEKQFEVHEGSKKHQKAVHTLKRRMEREDNDYHLNDAAEKPRTDLSESENNEQLSDNMSAIDKETPCSEDANKPAVEAPIIPSTRHVDPVAAMMEMELRDKESSGAVSEDLETKERELNNEMQFQEFETATNDISSVPSVAPKPKLGKAAQKRAKRAAQEAALDSSDLKHICGTCGSAFPSRTRMFQHISDNKHAMAVTASKTSVKGKGKKR